MTIPVTTFRRRLPLDQWRIVREMCGLAVMVAGVTGLLIVGFLASPLLGWALVSGLSVAVGAALATGRP